MKHRNGAVSDYVDAFNAIDALERGSLETKKLARFLRRAMATNRIRHRETLKFFVQQVKRIAQANERSTALIPVIYRAMMGERMPEEG